MSDFRLEWIDQYLKTSPTVIIDVGTYDGADAVTFKRRYPVARVCGIEACAQNFLLLQSLDLQGVEIYRYAVCDKSGPVIFRSSSSPTVGNGSGSIHPPNDQLRADFPDITFSEASEVPGISLQDFCELYRLDHIDVLHMDAQGAEGQILQGLGTLRPSLIFLETSETRRYDGALLMEALHSLLETLGYRLAQSLAYDALYAHESAQKLVGEIKAPWSPEQVTALNDYQREGYGHPYTCSCCNPRNDLVATIRGWICPYGNHVQDWALWPVSPNPFKNVDKQPLI